MDTLTMELAVKRLIKFDGEGAIKAYCDLAIGEAFLIRGLRVVDGKNGLFVSMPRQQGKNGKWFDTITAMSKPTKDEVNRVVLDAYQKDTDTSAG